MIKNKLKELFTEKKNEAVGYVIYVFDLDKMETRLFPLSQIKPVLEIKRYNETYKLDKPIYYVNGIPYFLIIRDFPISITMESISDKFLTLKGYSASEIDAKVNSIYTNIVYRKGAMQLKDYMIIILSNVISILSTYIACSLYFQRVLPSGV